MNKIIQVNLGGYPFTLDEDAYARLQQYLDSLKRHFGASPSCDEIVGDIEQRLAELLLQHGEGRIVSLSMVEAALGVLGQPAEIDDAPASETAPPPYAPKENRPASKRLYRNPDDALSGGVCSGLAAYFGLADPVWIRIGFVASAFVSAGFTLIIYLLLYFSVPAARTAAQKLEMRGESINVDNIARTLEEAAQRLGDNLQKGAEKVGKSPGLNQSVTQVGNAVARLLLLAIKAFAVFFSGTMLLVLGAVWLAITISFSLIFGELNDYFFPNIGITWVAFLSALLLLGLPMLWILMNLLRILFRYKTGRWFRSTTGGLFVLSLIGLGGTALLMLRQFKDGAETKSEALLALPEGKPSLLRLEWHPLSDSVGQPGLVIFDETLFGETAAYLPNVRCRVRASADSTARLVVHRSSMGSNHTEARRLAESIGFDWRQEGDKIVLDDAYRILRGDKWRLQELTVWLELPVGSILQYDAPTRDRKATQTRTFTIHANTNERL